MKMCEIDRRRCGEYNGNNENDNSISTFKGVKMGFCLLLERKKGFESPWGKMMKILKFL